LRCAANQISVFTRDKLDCLEQSGFKPESRSSARFLAVTPWLCLSSSGLTFPIMVANVHGPQFSGGANIAIKCPAHTYEQTVAFYRDTLALPLIEEETDGCIFQFGPNRLWVDLVPNLSQPDVWLELETNDTEAAASFLKINGIPRRDEVEQLREDFDGFFISAPNGVIHLVIGHEEA
jgi:hypothetical protein